MERCISMILERDIVAGQASNLDKRKSLDYALSSLTSYGDVDGLKTCTHEVRYRLPFVWLDGSVPAPCLAGRSAASEVFEVQRELSALWSSTGMSDPICSCGATYPVKRHEMGYRSCLSCGEAAAQKIATKLRQISAPLYNKGAYQPVWTREDALNIGRK
jgi:hypothetical protein